MRLVTIVVMLSITVLVVSSRSNADSAVMNRIEGQVYDSKRVPVPEVWVELLNAVDSVIGRTRTNSAGRFTFFGMPQGRYQVRVLSLGKGLLGQTQDVEINNQMSRSDIQFVDFYLQPDKREAFGVISKNAEAVFAQEVPKEARQAYESALKLLDGNAIKGISQLELAVKIFPNYFDALSRLGKEYVTQGDYQTGYPYLLRAIDINTRSFSTYYSLAYAFYKMGQLPAAVLAARASVKLNGNLPESQLLLGIVTRLNGDFTNSRDALVKAKSLSNGKNPEASWQLALLLNRLGNNTEAAKELELYLKLVPDSPDKQRVLQLIERLRKSQAKVTS